MLKAYVTWITLPKKYLWAIVLLGILGFLFVSVLPAFAALDVEQSVENALRFVKLVIIVAVAAAAMTLFVKSQIVPAVMLVVAGALVYALLSPAVMEDLGQGFTNLLGLSGGDK